MAYNNRFNSVDLLIAQLTTINPPITDPLVISAMAGIVAVEAVTAYELAIKDIIEEFSQKKNKVFGTYVRSKLGKLNGRIQYKDIKENLVKDFGEKYHNRFKAKIEQKKEQIFASKHVDFVQIYNNLIVGRHKFVHEGILTMTLQEAIMNYKIGKELIGTLYDTMKR